MGMNVVEVCDCGRCYSGYHCRWIRFPGQALAQVKSSGLYIRATCNDCQKQKRVIDAAVAS